MDFIFKIRNLKKEIKELYDKTYDPYECDRYRNYFFDILKCENNIDKFNDDNSIIFNLQNRILKIEKIIKKIKKGE